MRRSQRRSDRLSTIDWEQVETDLAAYGAAVIGPLIGVRQCQALARLYAQGDDTVFRRRVIMSHHGYGCGEYRYFAYPLPEVVDQLRTALYQPLAAIANRWNDALRVEVQYPLSHREFLDRCHAAGQEKPTPLLLAYEAGDYNCLHQDLYGEHVFPLQAAFLLSVPGRDFTGGEFVLTEQQPRRQSRVEVVELQQGQGVIFPVHQRPFPSSRGYRRARMRHGVSRVRSGQRHTLGIIFHDAA